MLPASGEDPLTAFSSSTGTARLPSDVCGDGCGAACCGQLTLCPPAGSDRGTQPTIRQPFPPAFDLPEWLELSGVFRPPRGV
jgi:hypothetical protein